MNGSPDSQKSECVRNANRHTGTKRNKICSVSGCERKHFGKGYCTKHYWQVRNCGKVLNRTGKDPNEFWFEGDICFMQIYDSKCNPKCEVVIDKEDYEKIKDYKWCIDKYKTVLNSSKVGLLSRFITNTTDPNIVVDHKNHDRLDNRKENLRPCTKSQNQANTHKQCNNTSGYKGVRLDKKSNVWVAVIYFKNKGIYLGRFKNKKSAAKKYNQAAKKLFGSFALLNIIPEEKNNEE